MYHYFYRHIVIPRIEAVRNEDRMLREFSSDIKTEREILAKGQNPVLGQLLCTVKCICILYLETIMPSMFSSFDIIS